MPSMEASIIFAILDADKSDELKIDEFVQLGVDLSGLHPEDILNPRKITINTTVVEASFRVAAAAADICSGTAP